MLNSFLFISYLDMGMLPAREEASREVRVPSVMNETRDTDNRGIVLIHSFHLIQVFWSFEIASDSFLLSDKYWLVSLSYAHG